jgi:UDP-N-acetylglucosamine 2-epimerase (non-hydrolysing)
LVLFLWQGILIIGKEYISREFEFPVMKVFVLASTRPEVIKLSPVIRELESRGISYVFATTGQHYDELLFKKFIEDLNLKAPDYDIEVGSGSQATQTGRAMMGIEKVLMKESPDVVVVEGDTNSVLSGALAAVKLKVPVAHVEAGLRSHDRTMPEEINRILADRCSEVLFAPTEASALNLVNEGISPKKIHVVGNTIVDATFENLEIAQGSSKVLEGLPKGYMVLTLHRQENTDDPERLKGIVTALRELKRSIIFPVHPRTAEIIKGTEIEKLLESKNIHIVPPLGYLDFLMLLKNAFAVLTDSGGVQEEAIILNVPCLTLRYNTERPETVWAGGNIIAGTEKEEILDKAALLDDSAEYKKMKNAKNPFGDGSAGEKIVTTLIEKNENCELVVESSDLRGGFYSRRLIPVDSKLAGIKVEDAGYEIIKIIEEWKERFPFPEVVLKEGQFVEVLTKV